MWFFFCFLLQSLQGRLAGAQTTSWLLASSVQLGDSNPASVKEWAHLLTASKQRAGPSASPEIMVSVTAGCLWRTIFRQSAQLAQWAPSLILVALVSPKLPWKKGNEAVTSALPPPSMGIQNPSETFPRVHRGFQQKSESIRVGPPLSQYLALVDAHMSKSNQAACGSLHSGDALEESAVLVCLLLEKAAPLGSQRS